MQRKAESLFSLGNQQQILDSRKK